jgi:hypothetical protein
VGWLLLAMGLGMAVSAASVSYIPHGLVVRPGSLPAANVVARVYPATIYAVLAVLGFHPAPHPDRVAAVVPLAPVGHRHGGCDGGLVAAMTAPGWLDPLAQFVSGPFDPTVYGGALRVANQLALLAGLLTVLGGAASLVARFAGPAGPSASS